MSDQTSPSRRAGLRDEIAAALEAADYSGSMRRGDLADAILPVLYREWPWMRAEAESHPTDLELRRQLDAVIRALGHSETENAELRARIKTLEHVAAGNKRHVQLIVPDLERTAAAISRVRHLAIQSRDHTAAGLDDYQIGQHDLAATILAELDGPGAEETGATPAELTGHPCPCCGLRIQPAAEPDAVPLPRDEEDDTDLTEADVDRRMAAGTPVQIVTEPPTTFVTSPHLSALEFHTFGETPVAPSEPADAPRSPVQAAGGPAERRDGHDAAEGVQGGAEHITANTPLICSDERHAAKVADLEQRVQQVEELLHIANETSNKSEAARAQAARRAAQLAVTLQEVLARFTEHGHPGTPCMRTPWLNTTTIDRWRAVLNPQEQP